MARLSVSLALLVLAGCGRPPEDLPLPERASAASEALLHYASPDPASATRRKHYYLVAGASDAANYALEVVQQKRYLESRGVPRSDIACFYARPTDDVFEREKHRFEAIARDLADCFPANAAELYRQLGDGPPATTPIYVYVSSHGRPPIGVPIAAATDEQRRAQLLELVLRVPAANHFLIQLASDPTGASRSLDGQLNLLYRRVRSPGEVLLTPKYLADALDTAAARGVERRVVLQACFSGGFLRGLTGPDTTVMTASRADRASFGCGIGAGRTYFGGAFTDALVASGKLPQDADVHALHGSVTARVRQLERAYAAGLPPAERRAFLPSEPQLSVRRSGPTVRAPSVDEPHL